VFIARLGVGSVVVVLAMAELANAANSVSPASAAEERSVALLIPR